MGRTRAAQELDCVIEELLEDGEAFLHAIC
jgi:hypothetical protein